MCVEGAVLVKGDWGDSLVLHCASLLSTIFVSLALAHERVLVQNVRDFTQTKLYSEINAPFLLNEHCDPHFLFHNFNERKSNCVI